MAKQRRWRRTVPRHADPYRWHRQYPLEPLVDLYSRRIPEAVFRHNGFYTSSPAREAASSRPERSMLKDLLRRVSKEVSLYRQSGQLTEKELELIEALWLDAKSASAVARERGVSRQAICEQIERLRGRAPRFVRWWELKNRARRRSRTHSLMWRSG